MLAAGMLCKYIIKRNYTILRRSIIPIAPSQFAHLVSLYTINNLY